MTHEATVPLWAIRLNRGAIPNQLLVENPSLERQSNSRDRVEYTRIYGRKFPLRNEPIR